jgi:hypothetical protein
MQWLRTVVHLVAFAITILLLKKAGRVESPGSRTTKGAPLAYETGGQLPSGAIAEDVLRRRPAVEMRLPLRRAANRIERVPAAARPNFLVMVCALLSAWWLAKVAVVNVVRMACPSYRRNVFWGAEPLVASGPPWRLIEQSRRRNGGSMALPNDPSWPMLLKKSLLCFFKSPVRKSTSQIGRQSAGERRFHALR